MGFSKKKGPIYSAAEKRAYYIGFGLGLGGRKVTEDYVQDVVMRQLNTGCRESMLRGVMDAGTRKPKRK